MKTLTEELAKLPGMKYELQVDILNKMEGMDATTTLMNQIRETATAQALADPANTNDAKRKNAVAFLLRENPKYQELDTTQKQLNREIAMNRLQLDQLNDKMRVMIAILGG